MCDISGGESSGKSNSNTNSGFSQLPASIQNAYTQYANTLNNSTSDQDALTAAYTPNDLNSGATSALSNLSNSAYSPTADSIKSDIEMQTNPYDSSVIDTYNREANGSNSQLKQAQSTAGQFGSNRAQLGANDVDLTRLNQIGTFKQEEYNTALNNALTTLPNQRTTAAQNAVSAGTTEVNNSLAQSEAPYTALSSYANLLSALPTSGGSTSTSNSSNQSANGSCPV